MKYPSFTARGAARRARGASLTAVAAAALCLVHLPALAFSLGRLTVQSALGEALRAEIDITNLTAEEATSLRSAVASPEAFRTAGVDFNPVLMGAQASLARRPDGKPFIRITGERSVSEPFVDLILDFSWANGRLQRAYTLLIDPPARGQAVAPPAVVSTAPIAAAPPPPAPPPVALPPAPVPAPPTASPPPVAAPSPSQSAPPPAPSAAPTPVRPTTPPPAAPVPPPPAPRPAAAPRPAPAPSAAASSADNYRVRRGDSLSAIASANARAGVSLDQMLVALYRGNPQAFVDNNMNRLKAGVVLELPGDAAGSVAPAEARQIIQAHSADFAAFKQRLAGAAPSIRANEPARQATGKVQTAVQDKKADAAPPTPDKLELSRGAVKPEAQISKETERKAAETRVAELSRNVEELKRLSTSTAAAPPAAAPASAAASLPGVTLPVAPPVLASAAASAVVQTPAAASEPTSAVAQTIPEPASAASDSASASAPVAPPIAASAASRPASGTPASAPTASVAPSGSFIESLADNPYVWPAAAALVALLAGLGLMALRRRSQEAGSETSFLESKQSDSFFGASGGQHVDTREAGAPTGSSSLSYSLSQLDAIGDVDPVAEADVYLAYGRDLQAEEILKEALRSDPSRLPIRTKLLEVYAKRADLKGFEAQARQLHELTGGEGEDWAKAQELGLQLDPANPLYALPAHVDQVDIDTSSEPPPDLRAELPIEKTQPFDQPARSEGPPTSYDLDIDLDSPSQLTGLEMTQPATPEAMLPDLPLPDLSNDAAPAPKAPGAMAPDDIDLGEPDDEPPRRDPPVSGPVDFDFGDLSLELENPAAEAPAATPATAPAAATPAPAPAVATPPPAAAPAAAAAGDVIDEDDPLARKIELADEFRRIGDLEGARDLLDEVLGKATGAMRARAEAMLKDLG